MSVHVHIERLIVEGLPVDSGDGTRIGAAVERELARLLKAGGLGCELRVGGSQARVRGGTVTLAARTPPTSLGVGIARAIHEGIGEPVRGGSRR